MRRLFGTGSGRFEMEGVLRRLRERDDTDARTTATVTRHAGLTVYAGSTMKLPTSPASFLFVWAIAVIPLLLVLRVYASEWLFLSVAAVAGALLAGGMHTVAQLRREG